jgi:penicillin amidase
VKFGASSRWTVAGEQPIVVTRDEHGVPHVRAASEADLYRGLGSCHGVDRALQLLLARILTEGRACECLHTSEEMLRLDRFFRRMNFAADAADEVASISPADHVLAEAYCAGVNDALARRVPWELRLVGYRPEPWTLVDCVRMSRVLGYLALAQSQGDAERLLVEMVQAGVPRAHLDALFPGLLGDLDEQLVRRITLGEPLVPTAVRWQSALPHALASNNWVIAGRKTASGSPLLANDPHLEANRLPAVWYEVVLELGERFCIAATMPGVPGAILGRNNDLAWGATYTFMDAIDSWVEDCRDGCYRRMVDGRETWVPFRTRQEVIARKREPPVVVTIHENEHGVLDGDPTVPGLYLATRWAAGMGTGAASLSASFAMLRATRVREGMELLGEIETAWNWVLADRAGDIGYQMSGRMPRRAEGRLGVAPLAGWDPANDWQGFVPAAELPRAYNPPEGFLATANNDLNALGRTRPITMPMGAYRAERIAELLRTRDDWDVVATQAMQMDVYAPQAAAYLDVLRPLLPGTRAGDVLRTWDCRYDLASRGATLFERFYGALVVTVFGGVCGGEVLRFLRDETGMLADFYANFDRVLLDRASPWYGDEGRDAAWQRVAARTLDDTAAEPWGAVNSVTMRHLLLGGRLPRWLGFDHGPVALRGGRATIHQGQIYRAGGRQTSFAPSYRLVTDLAEPAAHTSLGGGPSDRRFSGWYVSEVSDWLAGRFKTLRPAGNARS